MICSSCLMQSESMTKVQKIITEQNLFIKSCSYRILYFFMSTFHFEWEGCQPPSLIDFQLVADAKLVVSRQVVL